MLNRFRLEIQHIKLAERWLTWLFSHPKSCRKCIEIQYWASLRGEAGSPFDFFNNRCNQQHFFKKQILFSNQFDLRRVGLDFGLCVFDKATDVKTSNPDGDFTLETSFKMNGNIDGTPETTNGEVVEAARAHFLRAPFLLLARP